MHILSPETDNCPSWISRRERMTIENISWSISTKECCRPLQGWTRDLLVSSRTAHPTEPPRPAGFFRSQLIWIYSLERQGIYGFSRTRVKFNWNTNVTFSTLQAKTTDDKQMMILFFKAWHFLQITSKRRQLAGKCQGLFSGRNWQLPFLN